MKSIKVCIVGAGSSYTPELIDGILSHNESDLPIAAISMQDVDERRMGIMAGLAGRMIRRSGRNITLASSRQLEPMLEGADFVITQIRVGGMDARALDEKIPLKYGVIGQETTGPGGMCKALRTIPQMLEIMQAVCRVAPQAFVLNYTNPSGIVAEAMLKHTKAKFIGLCSGIPGIQADVSGKLKDVYPDLKTYCVGLNHLGFVHRFLSGGKDVTAEAINTLSQRAKASGNNAHFNDLEVAKLLNSLSLGYLHYYVLRGRCLKHAQEAKLTRAEQIKKIEAETFAQAADGALDQKPQALQMRGGSGYADVTFSVMKAILHDSGAEIVTSVLNHGCVEGIEDDAAVEVVCRVDKHGVMPLPVGQIPLAFRGLVQAVKAYETLTVEAAMTGSKQLALLALLAHPLVGDLEIARPMLDELIAAHGLKLA